MGLPGEHRNTRAAVGGTGELSQARGIRVGKRGPAEPGKGGAQTAARLRNWTFGRPGFGIGFGRMGILREGPGQTGYTELN